MPSYFFDLSQDTETHYRIVEAGTFVFFFHNRNGVMKFSLEHENARVFIFGLYEGIDNESFHIETHQHHLASGSVSKLVLKSVLKKTSSLFHQGTIRIEPDANLSESSLESRHLLLSEQCFADARPQLEILANNVRCSHAVTLSPVPEASINHLRLRGLSPNQAKRVFAKGFLDEIRKQMHTPNNPAV